MYCPVYLIRTNEIQFVIEIPSSIFKALRMRSLVLLFIIVFACRCSDTSAELPEFVDERLSAAVSYVKDDPLVEAFLAEPDKAFIKGHFLFEKDLAEDVIMGFDIEWFEGVENPIYISGGDWMAFAGFTPSGHLWVPVGSPENLQGIPTMGDNVEVYETKGELEPNVWYEMTIECNYKTRTFESVTLTGGALDVRFDLDGVALEYPNYVSFDKSTITIYCFASRSVVLAGENKEGNSKVYFDDVEAGIWTGSDFEEVFTNGFEEPNALETAPYDFNADVNPLDEVNEGVWFSENEDARLEFSQKLSRSGDFSLECDASLVK